MDRYTVLLIVVIFSEIVAVFLIRRIWQREDYRVIKIMMTVVALIPVVGTLGILWVYGFPAASHPAVQNRSIGYFPTLDVFDRWRHVLDEKDEKRKQHAARKLLDEHRDD